MIAACYIFLRFAHFSCLLLVSGCACYRVILAPKEYAAHLWTGLRRYAVGGAVVSLVASIGMFAAQTILMSGESDAILQPGIWSAVAGTRFGYAWRPEIILSVVSLLLVYFRGRKSGMLLLLSCVARLVLMAMTGHAAMHDGFLGAAGELSQTIHLVSAAFWAGGLFPLLWLMKQAAGRPDDRSVLLTMIRFSGYGHWAVALTILSGSLNTMLIAGFPLYLSPWLLWLLLKVSLVMGMVAIALFNRYWLVPRFKDSSGCYRQRFLRLTQLEFIISLVVIGVASGFATLSPV